MPKTFGRIIIAIGLAAVPASALAQPVPPRSDQVPADQVPADQLPADPFPADASQSFAPTLGTISVEADPADPKIAASVATFVDAVGSALTARGFTMIDGVGHAALVADLHVTRTDLGMTTTRVSKGKAAIGPGVGAGIGGVSIALGGGASRDVPLRQMRLDIRIRKRGENKPVWQGAALTVRAAETPQGQDAVVAADLAEAALRAYPTRSGVVVSVP